MVTTILPTSMTARARAVERTPRIGRAGALNMGGSASSAANSARAESGRLLASFSRHCMMSREKGSGTSVYERCGAAGICVSCAARVACGEVPMNGELPVSSS